MEEGKDSLIEKIIRYCGDWFSDYERVNWGKMTNNLYPYKRLFEPIQINSIRIKNRIVMGPMGNINMADQTGRPSNKMIQYFAERAKGGTGLISSGLVHVSQKWDKTLEEREGYSLFPRILGPRTYLPGWRAIAQAVHAYGSHFFIQLSAGMGRVGSPECLITRHRFPISASLNPNFYAKECPCLPIRGRKLKKIVKAFGEASLHAKAVGIDGVYLHGHEGYLLEQMTNPAYNRRKLGRYRNWQQFGIDIIHKIREIVGPKYPIWYRIDLSLALNAVYGSRMREERDLRKFSNERTPEMTLDYMKQLVRAGVDMFDVDLGCYENWWLPHPPNAMPPGCYLEVSQYVKKEFDKQGILSNQDLPVPIVAVGKLGYPDLAEHALREKYCDMIMLARPLLADPEWANKVFAGRTQDIRPCIGDHEGCINEFVTGGGQLQCAVNPRTGFEDLHPNFLPLTPKSLKIAVIGAGPAGIVFSCTAAQRGHRVELFDRNNEPGGLLISGAKPVSKFDVINYIEYLGNCLEKISGEYDLKINFSTEISPEFFKNHPYDAIVIATGANPIKIPLPGIALPHVFQAIDILNSPSQIDNCENIVVIGGGMVGCEVAHFLAIEMGKRVKIIEILPQLMTGACTANRTYLLYYLSKRGVEFLNCTEVKEIQPDKVRVLQNVSKSVPDPTITWHPLLPINAVNPLHRKIKQEKIERELPCDAVILAAGLRPNDKLYQTCLQESLAPLIYNIGDSFCVGRVFEAVKAGYILGKSI